MAIHFNILAWRILWTEEPGGLQFIRLQVEHHWNDLAHTFFLAILATGRFKIWLCLSISYGLDHLGALTVTFTVEDGLAPYTQRHSWRRHPSPPWPADTQRERQLAAALLRPSQRSSGFGGCNVRKRMRPPAVRPHQMREGTGACYYQLRTLVIMPVL